MTPLNGLFLILLLAGAGTDDEDQDLERRVGDLETRNAELERRLEALSDDVFRLDLGAVVPPMGESVYGLGPAASKVYATDQGVSIGGYGELLYRNEQGGTDEFDLLRAVLYFGYKFSDRWVFNSEIEFEHAGEEVGVEFATLDYLACESLGVRAGLVLLPVGFVNELHEPTTFLSADRPQTETRIIPTTWRENGVGVFGDAGPVSYRAYVVNGFDGAGYDAAGLRGGRQNGSEALADDLAIVARADWTDTPGVLAGASVYHGDAGQGQSGLGDTTTTVWELHGEAKLRGFWLRGLYAMATVDDVEELNANAGFVGDQSVGEEMNGGYLELAYDVMPLLDADSDVSIRPFARYEMFDTQAEVPSGFSSDPANDEDIVTFGVQVMPIDHVVLKVDYQDWDEGEDRFSVLLGYAF